MWLSSHGSIRILEQLRGSSSIAYQIFSCFVHHYHGQIIVIANLYVSRKDQLIFKATLGIKCALL